MLSRAPGRPGAGRRRPQAASSASPRHPYHWLLVSGLIAGFATGALPAQPLTFQDVLVDAGASGDDKEVADLDGDGDLDGILGGSTLSWYRSRGLLRSFGGPFLIRTAAVEFTTDMAVADIDQDGDTDLIVADGNSGTNLHWYENPVVGPPPGGTTDPTVTANWLRNPIGATGNWTHDVELGRIDGDTLLDVVTIGDGGPFRIFFRNANGTWTMADFSQHASDGSPAIADVDGDGDLDVFVRGGWVESPPSGRRTAANWTFHSIDAADPGDGPAAAALDVNRDGRVDLVTCPQHGPGTLAWFRNPANPEQATWPRTVISANGGSHHLRVADFDGDYRRDLLTGLELSAGNITVWRITGSPPVFTPFEVAAGGGGHNAAVGDLDGNGLPDVWAADWIGNPPLRAYFNGPNVLFRDGFESGNRSKWSSSQP